MARPKISITTPSVRPNSLELNALSLSRQTFQNFEWLIGSPQENFIEIDRQIGHDIDFVFVPEPPKNKGDFYGLNKSYNSMFKKAKGELIVSYQDQIEIEPTTLERFWAHYEANNRACIGAIGHQYTNGVQVWADPRQTMQYGSFYECGEEDVEYTLASIPKEAIYKVGGMKEKWDLFAALSEKEMNVRMYKAGYKFYLDQSIIYKAEHHPRLSSDWDKKYQEGCVYYRQCMEEIKRGEGLQGDLWQEHTSEQKNTKDK